MESNSLSSISENFYYKLCFQYLGTQYMGWQYQDHGKTVQGEILNVLKLMSKSSEVKIVGSGRTDAGVHALGQIAKVTLPIDIPPLGLMKGLNSLLPIDIKAIDCTQSDAEFHPTFQAKYKEYNYVFCLNRPSPFARPLMTYYSYKLSEELLHKAAAMFVGTFDFSNFYCLGTDIQTTTRTIFLCEIVKYRSEGHWSEIADEYYVLRIIGNGFLKQMVRMIMGSIWNVARGKASLDDLKNALINPKFGKIGPVAAPEGLYLKEVIYDHEYGARNLMISKS